MCESKLRHTDLLVAEIVRVAFALVRVLASLRIVVWFLVSACSAEITIIHMRTTRLCAGGGLCARTGASREIRVPCALAAGSRS